jgi:uncharacterized protein (TIGR03790 family)
MTKKLLSLLSIALLHVLLVPAGAQSPVTYNDVLVIVNTNSSLSINVGNYFKAQRGVPSQNICALPMPTTEEIDSLQFLSVSNLIKNYMIANSLTNSINYMVTTQGVPLKVRRSGSVMSTVSTSSSFDGDLCLINSSSESQIGNAGRVSNPYGYSLTRFSHSPSFGNIYLVTRLAGYSYSDITGLIDRAKQPYHSSGVFVLDADPSKGLGNSLNQRLTMARDTLLARGFNVMYDATPLFMTKQTGVLGYVSWGSNDPSAFLYSWKAQPDFVWSPKALAETYVSTSGRSFSDSTFVEPSTGWQSLVADLIHENGVTGVKGYVYEPYSSAISKADLLFDRWSSGFNLAESYSIASSYIGWMDVIIGDPKATLAGEGHLPVQLVSFSGVAVSSGIKLTWKTATEINNVGFDVEKMEGNSWKTLGFVSGNGTVFAPRTYSFVDENPMQQNTYRLKQIDRDGTSRYSTILSVLSRNLADRIQLYQNYPNPVLRSMGSAASTTISFTLPETMPVTLTLYDATGRVVERIIERNTLPSGVHAFPVALRDDISRGMYFYVLEGEGWSMQRPMSVVM